MSEILGSCLICGRGVIEFKIWIDPGLVIDHTKHGICEECFDAARQNAQLRATLNEAIALLEAREAIYTRNGVRLFLAQIKEPK